MLGGANCPASQAILPHFMEMEFPEGVQRSYVNIAELANYRAELRIGTPTFVVVHDDEISEIHSGAVDPVNSFAAEGNADIFRNLFQRAGILSDDTDVWGLMNSGDNIHVAPYSPASYRDFTGRTFDGDLSYVVFSQVLLRDADLSDAQFKSTVFSFVDMTGAKLPADLSTNDLLILNSICPDGEPSSELRCR